MRRWLWAVLSCSIVFAIGCGTEECDCGDVPGQGGAGGKDGGGGGGGGDAGSAGEDGGGGTGGTGGSGGEAPDTSWIEEPVEACTEFEAQKALNHKVPLHPDSVGAFPPLEVGFREEATIIASQVGRIDLRTRSGRTVQLRWHESALFFATDEEAILEQTRDWTIVRLGNYYVLAVHGSFGPVGNAELEPIAYGNGVTTVRYEMQCDLPADSCAPQAVAAVISRGEASGRAMSGLGADAGQNQNVWTVRHVATLQDATCMESGPQFSSMVVVEGLFLDETKE